MNSPGPLTVAPVQDWGARIRRVLLRVVLTLIPLVTMGVLAWIPMLWLAIVQRRVGGWVACGVVAVLSTGGFIMVGEYGDDSWQSAVGVAVIIMLAIGIPVYYLVTDLRRHDMARRNAFHAQYGWYPHPWPPGAPYSPTTYPPTAHPPTAYPPAGYPQMTYSPALYPPLSHSPSSTPIPLPPPAPSPSRIDQVRAELDALSSQLRQQADQVHHMDHPHQPEDAR